MYCSVHDVSRFTIRRVAVKEGGEVKYWRAEIRITSQTGNHEFSLFGEDSQGLECEMLPDREQEVCNENP